MRNDLEPASIRVCPEIEEVLALLRNTDALRVAVTGSGSTVFAVYESRKRAVETREQLDWQPSWWLHIGETIAHDEAKPHVTV
jgi:4-diphosphocytidyl-2C-methyl-D-erythritol kinase